MNKGALSLLSVYNSGDSSEEDIPVEDRLSKKRCLPDEESDISYKKSRNDCTDSNVMDSPVLQLPRLPLPQMMEYTPSEPVEDPSLHNGRLRSFPHKRGNWATYVYTPYDPPESVMEIIHFITNALAHLNLQHVDHFHISLTKTVIVKHHWIESLMQTIREKILPFQKFVTVFDVLQVYCNEERTRTFIGFDIKSGHDTLISIVNQLDICLTEFRLPTFYQNPSFHMSLVWCIGDQEAEIRSLLPDLNFNLLNYYPNNLYNVVAHLECKCGNKTFSFNLS